MKKCLFLVIFFLIACAIFHKSILGAGIKFALSQCHCELAYRSLDWKGGKLLFSDLVVFDDAFCAHIETATLQLDWSAFPKKLKGHLTIERPYVSILKTPKWFDTRAHWFDFTVSIWDGRLNWDGVAHFCLDHTPSKSQCVLEWDQSSATIARHPDKWEVDLRNFQAVLLKKWVPFIEVLDGHLTGRIALNTRQELISAHLKMDRIGIAVPNGSVEHLKGAVSYHAKLGAKWELQGMGKAQGKPFPFTWNGRGFFKSCWVESDLQFADASCKISWEEGWILECRRLRSEQLALLQAGAAVVYPEITSWCISRGIVDGKASFSDRSWNIQFEGEDLILQKGDCSLVCDRAKGHLAKEGGSLVAMGKGYDVRAAGTWEQWSAEARLGSLQLALQGGWDGEKCPIQIETGSFEGFTFSGEGWVDPHLDLSFNLAGKWSILQRDIPFYCPHFSKRGSQWAFDFRFTRQTWDWLRLCGTSDGKEVFYGEKSHFLGMPLHFVSTELGALDVSFHLPWGAVLSAGPLLGEWGLDLGKIPAIHEVDIRFQYRDDRAKISAQGAPFAFCAEQIQNGWKIDLQSDLTLEGILQRDGSAKGKGRWKTGLEVEFDGKIQPSLQCEFAFSRIYFDLAQIKEVPIEGKLEGQGHLVYKGQIESDFDFVATSLKIHSHSMENEGPIHLDYSSVKGALLRGIRLHGPLDCAVDLLEYDASRCHWIFHGAQVHLPGSLLTHRFLQFLDPQRDLDFTADLDFASDFSTFACTMREGCIPFDGASHRIEDLHLFWNNGECEATLRYLQHMHRLHLRIGEKIEGRFLFGEEETPLAVDWEYQHELRVHSIEGSFGGVEASFHAESPNMLIGSARVNFTALSQLLPAKVAEVFEEIKMGNGYELKGRLKIEKNTPYFRGILCGKQIELFGYQFRTLMAQVDLGPERMRIYDVKISDSAGRMKIDEIVLEGKNPLPWTIAMPALSIHEFRPSLLLRPGGSIGPLTPLVVRECTLADFKGLLDDGKTYTAKGQLRFINSYKREETVFDLPANVLSRIVGLDLELLIPVTGDLTFELKDGLFHLTELKNAYSEGGRSEFFLEMNPQPSMDLDGNLKIFVKMKQFVLLKFTESFLISIEGQLNDPQFHLTRKRFFGFM